VKKFESDGHRKDAIKAIGITNQRETIVCWNIKTGETIHNAIVWTDTRTASIARELKARPGSDKIKDLCGLPFSSYPTVTKLLWLLKNDETIRKTYEAEELAVGTVDSWLTYKLNGGARNPVFVTDASNASRTMLMDLHTVSYSDELFKFFSYEFDLHKIHFPKIAKSSCAESYGSIADGPLRGCPIAGCLGDQSAALVGQKGYEPGSAKNTYGTGCFLLYNVGGTPVISRHGLLATVAYDFGTPTYALEGSIAVAGSGVKFLMKNFGFGDSSEAITELAGSVEDSGGLVFVTAFSGLFAPYWIDDAQGTMCESLLSPSPPSLLSLSADLDLIPDVEIASRHHPPHLPRPHRARHARGRLLPDQSDPARDGAGQLAAPARAHRRRGHGAVGPLHADPGGHQPAADRAPQDAGDHRPRRRHRGRPGARRVEQPGGIEGRERGGQDGLRTCHRSRREREVVREVGARRAHVSGLAGGRGRGEGR
jgi:glycerol kinase